MAVIFVFVVAGVVWSVVVTAFSRARNEPPGPIPLPVIGNLLSLYRKPHLALKTLSGKYGDVMTLHVGMKSFVVVNSIDLFRENLSFKGHDFDGRADSYIGSLVSGGGNDLVFAEYGRNWKLHRKICTRGLAVAAGGRLEKLEEVILTEVESLVSTLLKSCGKELDPRMDISFVIMNTICYMAFGSRYNNKTDAEFLRSINYIDMIAESFENTLGCATDFFPWLKLLPNAALKRLHAALCVRDDLMSKQLEVHRLEAGNYDKQQQQQDFTSFLLKNGKQKLADKSIELLMFDLFGAGVDTTVVAVRWAIAYLIHWPKCQEKMAAEIHRLRPEKSTVRIEDTKDLPYTQAVVNEVLRLCSLFPISPRKATRDTKLLGYSIKKGTDVVFNLRGVNHDGRHWLKPDEFMPERFLENDGCTLKPLHQLSFAPFSMGKRACPGASIAKKEIFLFLANLVQHLRIEAGVLLPSLESVLTVSYKPQPYTAVFLPR
eukprot:gene7921-8776_t